MFYRVTQDEDMKISFKCSVAHQLLLKCTRSWIVFEQIAPSWSEHAHSSIYKQMAFVNARSDFGGLWWLIMWFFLCLQLIWILFAFLLRAHCIAPRWSTFQRVSRNVDVISVEDFANSTDVLVWKSFLFWNQISHFNDHVYSSLNVEMKSERCLFLKLLFFLLKFKLLWSKTQHTIQCSPLIVLYLENRNDPL